MVIAIKQKHNKRAKVSHELRRALAILKHIDKHVFHIPPFGAIKAIKNSIIKDIAAFFESEKATVNPKNYEDKCCQYALSKILRQQAALNYGKIGKDPQRLSKIKPFINS